MVVCGGAADIQYENDASVIVEVLSPTTIGTDRREKFEAYRQLPSLRIYLLVDPVFRRFEVYRPHPDAGGPHWQAYGPGGFVFTPYGVLHLDEIYAEVDALATT